jgi:hypothetical protein
MSLTEDSLSPPKRGEGQGEGFAIFIKSKLLTPALSSFGEERENMPHAIRRSSVKGIIPLPKTSWFWRT